MSKVYAGDVGTVLQVNVGTDISAATTTDLKVKKPDGTTVTWSGSPGGVGNREIHYTIITDDLDQSGTYKIQAYVVTASWDGLGETAPLKVYSAFD